MGWKTIKNINHRLPKTIRSKTIENSSKINNNQIININSIQKILKNTKVKKGFKRKILFKKLPRILKEKETFGMGFGIMKKTSEKGMVRLVKVAAGVKQ